MKFKKGDRVRIRAWDDMAKEYGAESDGSIKVDFHFTNDMRHMCGREATIGRIESGKRIILNEWSDRSGETNWTYSTDMIEPVRAAKNKFPAIIITTDGTTTTAMLRSGKEIVRTATAKCSPSDTFDHATGARLALDRLFDVEPVALDKAAEAEPVKLYCKETCEITHKLKKGIVYEFSSDGKMHYHDTVSPTSYKSFSEYKQSNRSYADCLVPLVKRPAKVGEWIYIADGHGHDHTVNAIGEVTSLGSAFKQWVGVNGGESGLIRDDQYLVLDGYKPEPEVREVKMRARVGEYVKIVSAAGYSSEAYRNGEIHKVAREDGLLIWLDCGGCGCKPSEYVVLEGYIPPND